MTVSVKGKSHREINEMLKSLAAEGKQSVTLCDLCGQRFIAAGFSNAEISVEGIPGNALGAYLNGAEITVMGNAQDAVGDTMNDGKIVVCGNIGDAAGYAMRGGEIYVLGNAGYRAGIHMKEYKEKRPVLVVGGKCGSFLGEYQAGGIIIVLGLVPDGKKIVSNFPCTGMHGGKVYLREPIEKLLREIVLPKGVTASAATPEDMAEIEEYLGEFCRRFGGSVNEDEIRRAEYTVIVPDSKNPYKQMYVAN